MTTTAFDDQFAPEPQEMPERDPSRPAEQQGLFRKFDVRRVDGSDAPGGRHDGCRYFVLDVDHDAYAAAALTAYAAACEATHPDLARDLRERWGAQPAAATPDEIDGLRAHVALLKTALAQAERENDELRAQPAAATVPAGERGMPDIAEFGELIDDYQCAQKDGSEDQRARARIALMAAYRAALAAPAAPQAGADTPEAIEGTIQVLKECGGFTEQAPVIRQLRRYATLLAAPTPPAQGQGDDCDDVDAILRIVGLDPERCRTEGGALNVGRVRTLWEDVVSLAAQASGQAAPSDDPIKPEEVPAAMVEDLRSAIEGECDGLDVTEHQARMILGRLLTEHPDWERHSGARPAASAEPRSIGYIDYKGAHGHARAVLMCGMDEHGNDWKDGTKIYATPVAAQAPQNDDETEGMRAHIALLRASLAQAEQELDDLRVATQAPAVPEGWKLVPVEPTLEMLDSADDAIRDFPRPVSRYETPLAPKIAYYKAMLAAAPTPPASAAPAADGDALREAVKTAYGYLWHVNNEPGTPNQYAPERAAYEARKVLREHLTKDERGEGINVVRAAMQRNGSEK